MLIFSSAGLSYAQINRVSPSRLESLVRRMCPMNNVSDGFTIEQRFQISEFLDGKWTCDDRAEVAKRLAEQYGYQTSYGIDLTRNPNILHRYVNLQDEEGNKSQILRWRWRPTED